MVIADWLSVLSDIPQQAVEDAVLEYLRGDTRRGQGDTLMAHIRKRALARIEPPAPAAPVDEERPFGPTLVSADEIERRRKMAEQVRREFPFLRKITEDGK